MPGLRLQSHLKHWHKQSFLACTRTQYWHIIVFQSKCKNLSNELQNLVSYSSSQRKLYMRDNSMRSSKFYQSVVEGAQHVIYITNMILRVTSFPQFYLSSRA